LKNRNLIAYLCPCCNRGLMSEPLSLAILELIRQHGEHWRITSGYRCDKHNRPVGGSPNSKHLTGDAIDLAPARITMPELVDQVLSIPAFAEGGFGWYPRRGIIHVDVRTTPDSWCQIDHRSANLLEVWSTQWPDHPLPKVPATLKWFHAAPSEPPLQQPADSASEPPSPNQQKPTQRNGTTSSTC